MHFYDSPVQVFWDNLPKPVGRNAVFSSGQHETYKHPHLATIKEFKKNGYKICPTNVLYGMKEYLEELSKSGLVLDTISEIDEDHIINGDKVFELS